jgi:hypothetical protein
MTEERLREAMINGLLDKRLTELEKLSSNELLNLFKSEVAGLVNVDGEWRKPND